MLCFCKYLIVIRLIFGTSFKKNNASFESKTRESLIGINQSRSFPTRIQTIIFTLKFCSLEKSTLTENRVQDYQQFSSIFYRTFSREGYLNPSSSESNSYSGSINFNCRSSAHMRFIQTLKFCKLLDANEIRFYNIKNKNKRIKNLLRFCFPNKANDLRVFSSSLMELNRSNYLNVLITLSSKVIRSVTLILFRLNMKQLKRLMAACRHLKSFNLYDCTLSIPVVPDFSRALINCNFQELSFFNCGDFYFGTWEYNLEEFKNLVQGLANSLNLRLSLKKVDISGCRINQKEAEEIFAKNQLTGVKIINKLQNHP
ncbi:unnamed protein product [Moneuplotes crassus]|uniref:Uncharacterized protein n=1 Tax=Euplotes crassus TaxID=5936 RepID=A0AAD1XGH5_EUPCR|nr:unnamed protein product [Moneuplotes crassus]